MGSKIVTFVGGPLDLTRSAVETNARRFDVPVLDRPLGSGVLAEGDLPSAAELSYSIATYEIEQAYTRDGKEFLVGIFQGITNQKSQAAAIALLRKELQQANDKLRFEQTQHRIDVEALVDERDKLKAKIVVGEAEITLLNGLVKELKAKLAKHTNCAREKVLGWAKCAMLHLNAALDDHRLVKDDLNLIIDETSR